MLTTYRCGMCNRRLKLNRWVYSTHTKGRYCWPGEGCQRKKYRGNVKKGRS